MEEAALALILEKCMDAMRDKIELETLWESGNAMWKVW